jgi:hypothetical protein
MSKRFLWLQGSGRTTARRRVWLDYWYKLLTAPPKPSKPKKKKAPLKLADLPPACRRVVGKDMPLGAPTGPVPVPERRSELARASRE